MSKEEKSTPTETEYLLSNETNKKQLEESIKQLEKGQTIVYSRQ